MFGKLKLKPFNQKVEDNLFTFQFVHENNLVDFSINLFELCNKNGIINGEESDEKWDNYIEYREDYEINYSKFDYVFFFYFKYRNDGLYLVEIDHNLPTKKKLNINFIGLDVTSFTEIQNEYKDLDHFFMPFEYKNVALVIFEIENKKFIKQYYLIPEIYSIQNVWAILKILNDNHDKIIYKNNDFEGIDFIIDDDIKLYTTTWHYENNRYVDRYSDQYIFFAIKKKVSLPPNVEFEQVKIGI